MKSEDSYTLNLNPEQILNLFRQLSYDDKLLIINELKSNTFKQRFQNLLDSLKTDDLTWDEITNEVEKVRKNRYDSSVS
jgi:S-adenosylmethionine:tRNA-ribosyltransferase-isomerase (queuine synthetase)